MQCGDRTAICSYSCLRLHSSVAHTNVNKTYNIIVAIPASWHGDALAWTNQRPNNMAAWSCRNPR